MAALASGVAIVTTPDQNGEPCGLLVTSVTSYSADPPSVLVSIANSSRSYGAFLATERIGIYLLAADQEPEARVFASKADDKFSGVDWSWHDGVPRIEGCLAEISGPRDLTFEHGDHAVVIVRAEQVTTTEREPLVYFRHRLDWRVLHSASDEPPTA
jgi:flavin reductase (DIM6/NTAB) family NADH-FMN oxidoreductase RutF